MLHVPIMASNIKADAVVEIASEIIITYTAVVAEVVEPLPLVVGPLSAGTSTPCPLLLSAMASFPSVVVVSVVVEEPLSSAAVDDDDDDVGGSSGVLDAFSNWKAVVGVNVVPCVGCSPPTTISMEEEDGADVKDDGRGELLGCDVTVGVLDGGFDTVGRGEDDGKLDGCEENSNIGRAREEDGLLVVVDTD